MQDQDLELRILGPLAVSGPTGPAALGGPRQRAVLARLLVSPGRVVSTDALVEALWDGQAPRTAVKTLQKYVSELRKATGGGRLIRSSGDGYLCAVGCVARLDALDFEHAVQEASRLRDEGAHERAAETLNAALSMWHGTPLGGVAEVEFVQAERARLDQLRLSAVENFYELQLDLGHHREAVAGLTAAVEEHPLSEALWASLIRALDCSGRQAEALRAYQRLRNHLGEELGLEPSPALARLERQILDEGATGPGSADPAPALPRGNLPSNFDSFVGRHDEITRIGKLFESQRLLTLTGPAGTGKTRLAVEAAHRLRDRFPGGVWLAELAPVIDPARVDGALADCLGLGPQPGLDITTVIVESLGGRGKSLLVIDNCEQIADACAMSAATLLARVPELRMIATSRRPLGLPGERLIVVPPLDLPATGPGPTSDSDAMALFADRAQALAADFELTADTAADVATICRRLDGLPLAIELAAARIRVLEPKEIAARLDDWSSFLAGGSSGVSHHQTLRAAVEWSHDLLSEPAREMLSCLGVFSGTFGLDAAEAVCSELGSRGSGVLDQITELVEHSLVVRHDGLNGAARFGLLETIRSYALEKLSETCSEQRARRAHAEFHRDLARRGATGLEGPDELTWRRRLEAEDANFRTAIRWAAEHDAELAISLSVELTPYWMARSKQRDGVEYLDELLSRHSEVSPSVRAWGLASAADMAANHGEARRALPWAEEAIATFADHGDELGAARAQTALGCALSDLGAHERAKDLLGSAERSLLAMGRLAESLHPLRQLGFLHMRRGELDQAERCLERALAGRVERGCPSSLGRGHWDLAVLAVQRRDFDTAARHCEQSLEIWRQFDDDSAIAHVRTTLADVARLRGDRARARELYEGNLDLFRSIGDPRCTASTLKNIGVLDSHDDRVEAALAAFTESMEIRYQLGDGLGVAECLEGLGGVFAAQGRAADAAALLGATSALRRDLSAPLTSYASKVAAQLEDELGHDAFGIAWDVGAQLGLDGAVEMARDRSRVPQSQP